jgi:hypothetical protein
MELPLATTRAKLKEANDEFLDVLDVFRIINLPPPRNWKAIVAFDASGDNYLHLDASPPLTDEELLPLLDGRVPSLFAFKVVSFRSGDKCFRGALEPTIWEDGRETFIPVVEDAEEAFFGQIKLAGYVLSPRLSARDQFEEWLHANTWFGSHKFTGKKYMFETHYMGVHNSFGTKKRSASSSCLFEHTSPLTIDGVFTGQLHFRLQPDGPRSIRHMKFGMFNPEAIDRQFWRKLKLGDKGIELEVDEPHLSWFTSIGSLDLRYLRQLLASAIACRADLEQNSKYAEFQESLAFFKKQVAAQKLLDRQQRLQRSPTVVCDGKEIMAMPTCENELVAIYMKLEALGKIPFECNVLEYTSRAGIDALTNYRLSPGCAFMLYAPIEFEYFLENYFDHEHPADQTMLIVCWDVNDAAADDRWRSTSEEWLYYARGGEIDIPVLVVSKIPGLQIVTGSRK